MNTTLDHQAKYITKGSHVNSYFDYSEVLGESELVVQHFGEDADFEAIMKKIK